MLFILIGVGLQFLTGLWLLFTTSRPRARIVSKSRRWHRLIAIAFGAPLLVTIPCGALYRVLRLLGLRKKRIEWLLDVHTLRCCLPGDAFGIDGGLDIAPIILGLACAFLTLTGLCLH